VVMKKQKEIFELKKEHLILLKHACITWEDCETGAPAIDCKRPYGNGSVSRDIIKILGWDALECPNCGEFIDEGIHEKAMALHYETKTALQLLLLGYTEPGTYEHYDYGSRAWRLIGADTVEARKA